MKYDNSKIKTYFRIIFILPILYIIHYICINYIHLPANIKNTEITFIKGVGPKRAEAFEKLGLKHASDLVSVYPRMYLKNITLRSLAKFHEQNVIFKGKVIDKYMPFRQNHPTRIVIFDGTASIESLLWGNAKFREKQFKIGDEYIFWGKTSFNAYDRAIKLEIRDHKKYEATDEEMMKYPNIPVYILSEELKKTWIRPLTLTKIIFNALKLSLENINEILSEPVRIENDLLDHKTAILKMHYPRTEEEIETTRRTLAFEELFYLQIIIALRKNIQSSEEKFIKIEKPGEKFTKLFTQHLGFELTAAQKKVIKEIIADMRSSIPMNRLLQGDVGSGKTIVAVFCMLAAAESGYQAAFMAPTEILAEQHYKTLSEYFNKLGIHSVILTGSIKNKDRELILNDIKTGNAKIIVGTHAIIQDKVEFNSLALAVIDEQHKFGVLQRAKLRSKGINPDILVMTATPIPRTLSLTLYGELEVSVIDELPKNRKNIKTALRGEIDRIKVYDFIRKEIKSGRQAYIVYPIIDESEKLDLKSAIKHYEILNDGIFSDLKLGLVHGRMPWKEIDTTINDFKSRKLDILVSTTVIEVGIDIPNASIMLIEEAQRFGLSQLHQLRGRVGRGAEQSYCILMAGDGGEISAERLKIMTETNDGFKISETDLKLRGPGEFFGTKQSGELKFTAADLAKDSDLINKAKDSAFKVIKEDPQLRSYHNDVIREHFFKNYKSSFELIKVA